MVPTARILPCTAAAAVLLLSIASGSASEAAAGARRMPRMVRSRRQDLEPPSPHKPSTLDCTWKFYTQPLSHFSEGSTVAGNASFSQRVCIIDKYWRAPSSVASGDRDVGAIADAPKANVKGSVKGPILFYTGNESPIEPYVNNTGLMWNLARKYGALIVFAEHRYEGESLPPLAGVTNCITYGTTAQAIADYVALVGALKKEYAASDAPVIAFGGSYGGMLAGWARIVYPHVFTGSIAVGSKNTHPHPHNAPACMAVAIV